MMEQPTAEEEAAVAGVLEAMGPEAISELLDAFSQSATAEEFVNRIMVGDCPKCGSSNTGDCEGDPEIEDPTLGRCLDCGQFWCLDCEELFNDAQTPHDCPAWEGIDFDDDEFDDDDLDDDDLDDAQQ